jgi:DNA-directed RNA polymerase subunit RPC12/RpoP
MFDEENSTKCFVCGKDLSDLNDPKDPFKRIPCPDCGSTIRHFYCTAKCEIKHSVSISSKIKDTDGFVKQKEKTRECQSDKTDRPVTITTISDRSNPESSTFYHKVEEYDEHGIIKRTIHEHTDPFPAKHRKKK